VRAFGWYNVFAFLPAAAGSAAAGGTLGWAVRAGLDQLQVYRGMLFAYAGVGVVLTLLYARLATRLKRREETEDHGALGSLGLGRSRAAVVQLAGLQAVDAFAGGFIMQSLLAYWFYLRFGARPESLGALFFGTNLLSALSFLVATRVAERIGLLNTMVFTHLPSNVLLFLVPVMPTLQLAMAALFLRFSISQMDVPTRQSYTMAVVEPEERSAAAGVTGIARTIGSSLAPIAAGPLYAVPALASLPFFIAGGIKIAYDLAIYVAFRKLPAPEERPRVNP
jgi:hypothetical protein